MVTVVFNNQAVDYGTGALSALIVSGTTNITSLTAYYTNVTVNSGGILKISRLSDFRCSGTLTINSGGIIMPYETGGGEDGNWSFYGGLAGFSSYPAFSGGGGGGGGYTDGGLGGDGDGTLRGDNNQYGQGFAGVGGRAYGSLTGIITYFDNLIPVANYNGGNGGGGGGAGGDVGAGSFKILTKSLINNGTIQANGKPGGSTASGGGGGGGGGGTIIIITDSESGSGSYSAVGGAGGTGGYVNGDHGSSTTGGAGGNGRIMRYVGASTYSGTFSAGNTSAESKNVLLLSDNPSAFSQTYPRLVWNNQIVDFGSGSDGGLIVSATTTLLANTSYRYSYISVLNGGILKISRTADVRVNGTVTVYSGGKIEGLDASITTQTTKNAYEPSYNPGTNWDGSSADEGGYGGGGAVDGSYSNNYSSRYYVFGGHTQNVDIVVAGSNGKATSSVDSLYGAVLYSDIIDAKYAGGRGSYGTGDSG